MKKGLGGKLWKMGMKAYSSSGSAHSIGFVRGYHGINKCGQNSLQSSREEEAHETRNQSSLWEDDDGMKAVRVLTRRLTNW